MGKSIVLPFNLKTMYVPFKVERAATFESLLRNKKRNGAFQKIKVNKWMRSRNMSTGVAHHIRLKVLASKMKMNTDIHSYYPYKFRAQLQPVQNYSNKVKK